MPLFAFTLLKYTLLLLIYLFLALSLVVLTRDILIRSSPGREARLVGTEGKLSGRSFVLSETTTIGRGGHNTLVLDDDYTSSSHAMIFGNRRGFRIQDLGSKNRTYVNGQPISRAVSLGSGDIIQVGKNNFRFEWENK